MRLESGVPEGMMFSKAISLPLVQEEESTAQVNRIFASTTAFNERFVLMQIFIHYLYRAYVYRNHAVVF
jgi:hypothetical protein